MDTLRGVALARAGLRHTVIMGTSTYGQDDPGYEDTADDIVVVQSSLLLKRECMDIFYLCLTGNP